MLQVDENPTFLRYDYPAFTAKDERLRRKPSNEPFYTSASQIYSGGSEDPYRY